MGVYRYGLCQAFSAIRKLRPPLGNHRSLDIYVPFSANNNKGLHLRISNKIHC
jgi:hypothetical protein